MVESFTKMEKNEEDLIWISEEQISDQGFVMFKVSGTCPSGDVKQAAGYDNMEFK